MKTRSISWCARWARVLPLAIIAALLTGGVTRAADTNAAPHKVSGLVRYHQMLKALPSGISPEQHKLNLRQQGLNPDKLDREEVAFYVPHPLTSNEVEKYHALGIEIHSDAWVPPVPGKHPNGFYLAEVPFSRLDELEQDERVARIETTESPIQLLDDVARAVTHVDVVQAGTGFSSPRNGAGVRIAIADDCLDLTHPDFSTNMPFEVYDVTTGDTASAWSTNVAAGSLHGTHVAGIVVGSGANSGGLYRGVAPRAQWAFYKIMDTNGILQDTAIIKSINRAVAAGCQIFTLSAGGYIQKFLDGSDPVDQAVDAAVASGVKVFVGAGNAAQSALHYSVSLAPGNSSVFSLTVSTPVPTNIFLGLLWSDLPNNSITLTCTNLVAGESLVLVSSDRSVRNTQRYLYALTGAQTKTYYLQLQSAPQSAATPLVHCYAFASTGATATFTDPDPNYTVLTPAVADGAIAVAAYVHRTIWTNCISQKVSISETLGQIGSFSSHGPRIDGLQKPDVAAPGSVTISTLSTLVSADAVYEIPNPGGGGCSYVVMEGTSMAAPHAAGIAALLLQAQPGLTPADLRTLMTTTASKPSSEDLTSGWGLLNASNSVHFAEANLPGVWLKYYYFGVKEGNFGRPFNTLAEAVSNAPSAGPLIIPRIRVFSYSNAVESVRITKAVRIESYGGSVHIGKH